MTGLPATVAGLDLDAVVGALARHGCNVTDASADLGVPASDLRRLLWANPRLQDQVFEKVEARIDLAEKNIAEALGSEDSRRRDAASFFVVRNSAKAQREGGIGAEAARARAANVNAAAPSTAGGLREEPGSGADDGPRSSTHRRQALTAHGSLGASTSWSGCGRGAPSVDGHFLRPEPLDQPPLDVGSIAFLADPEQPRFVRPAFAASDEAGRP